MKLDKKSENTADTTQPKFEVTDIMTLTARGAFLLGHIRGTGIKVGHRIERLSKTYTISGIESLANPKERKYWNSLIFREKPSKEELESAFTRGEIISDFLG